jgi:carboxylesterase type B
MEASRHRSVKKEVTGVCLLSWGSAGSFDVEQGPNLAREENIIVLRPNYRLGALGWVHIVNPTELDERIVHN